MSALLATLVNFSCARRCRHCGDGEIVLERAAVSDAPIAAPCGGCDRCDRCGGGCRAIAIADALQREGRYDVSAGFADCLYQSYRAGRLRLSANPCEPRGDGRPRR